MILRGWLCPVCQKHYLDCNCYPGENAIVTCNGCFDGLHQGHLFFLGFCRAQGTSLIVGINSDEYIIRNKRPMPIPEQQRSRDLLNLGFVQKVEVFKEDDPSDFIIRNKSLIHCISEEYQGVAPELKICKELGIRVVYVPRVGNWSTTMLRGKT